MRLATEGQMLEKPEDIFKDPYILEFTGLPEMVTYSETELENRIIDNLQKFLLELGRGFTFVGRQVRFTFEEEHFRVDLVFYNRLLRCFVLFDLKIGQLKHQDIGQMQMYVNYYDRKVKLDDENATIGIKNDDGSYGSAIKPLILIDNVEGDLDMVNPEDIETVTVLKDAASAAIYGARAAGGVILVTTKRPKGETSFQLNYNNNFAFATAMNLPEQAPLMEYLQAYSDAAGDQFWTMGSPSVNKWMGYLEQYRNNPSSIPTVGDGIFKDTDGAVYYMNPKAVIFCSAAYT